MATNPPRTRSVLRPDERLSGTSGFPTEQPCPPGQFRTASGCQPVSTSRAGGLLSPMPAIEALGGAAADLAGSVTSAMTPVPSAAAAAERVAAQMKASAAAAAKAAEKAATEASARAAAARGQAAATPAGQGERQKPPAPTAQPPDPPVGTGVGVTGQGRAKPEQSLYGGDRPGDRGRYAAMKLPNGRMVYGDVDSIKARVDRGEGAWGEKPGGVGVGDPQSRITSEGGATTLGPSSGFMAGRGLDRALEAASTSGRPFSEALRAEPMRSDLSSKGTSWTFTGGLGTGAPREGMRMLSGGENALAERDWRERRIREEQAREIGDVRVAAAKAQADRALRTAEMDPLALARIQAEGRYGGDVMKARVEAASREAAFNEFQKAMEVALQLPLGAERDQLIQFARDRASILLGNQYGFGKQDPLAALLGVMMGGAGAAAGGTPK